MWGEECIGEINALVNFCYTKQITSIPANACFQLMFFCSIVFHVPNLMTNKFAVS